MVSQTPLPASISLVPAKAGTQIRTADWIPAPAPALETGFPLTRE
jgi:hypothetical protein